MSNALHHNAALRVLRREMVRLMDGKAELAAALDDPRIPAGVAIEQARQCDREIAELNDAHRMLEAILEDGDTAVRFAAE